MHNKKWSVCNPRVWNNFFVRRFFCLLSGNEMKNKCNHTVSLCAVYSPDVILVLFVLLLIILMWNSWGVMKESRVYYFQGSLTSNWYGIFKLLNSKGLENPNNTLRKSYQKTKKKLLTENHFILQFSSEEEHFLHTFFMIPT